MLAVISAPNRSAHQRASGSGSVLSNVMEAMLTVMAAGLPRRPLGPEPAAVRIARRTRCYSTRRKPSTVNGMPCSGFSGGIG